MQSGTLEKAVIEVEVSQLDDDGDRPVIHVRYDDSDMHGMCMHPAEVRELIGLLQGALAEIS